MNTFCYLIFVYAKEQLTEVSPVYLTLNIYENSLEADEARNRIFKELSRDYSFIESYIVTVNLSEKVEEVMSREEIRDAIQNYQFQVGFRDSEYRKKLSQLNTLNSADKIQNVDSGISIPPFPIDDTERLRAYLANDDPLEDTASYLFRDRRPSCYYFNIDGKHNRITFDENNAADVTDYLMKLSDIQLEDRQQQCGEKLGGFELGEPGAANHLKVSLYLPKNGTGVMVEREGGRDTLYSRHWPDGDITDGRYYDLMIVDEVCSQFPQFREILV